MKNTIEGNLAPANHKFGIIVSRFNEFITKRLLDGALDCLNRHGVDENSIEVIFCPGAFEISQTTQYLINSNKYDAVICLGCIIRGETPHFDHLSNAVSTGLTRIALTAQIPVIFGVLTTDSLEQAIERAGSKGGNKGWEAALSAIELIDLYKKINRKKK
jgi:6,7-dimethyl-8-ribityllumazine synthase